MNATTTAGFLLSRHGENKGEGPTYKPTIDEIWGILLKTINAYVRYKCQERFKCSY